MSFNYKSFEIKKKSIIGAGQIGPDILLHFAKVFSGKNVKLVLVDVSQEQWRSHCNRSSACCNRNKIIINHFK